jgi:hypothetical protein
MTYILFIGNVEKVVLDFLKEVHRQLEKEFGSIQIVYGKLEDSLDELVNSMFTKRAGIPFLFCLLYGNITKETKENILESFSTRCRVVSVDSTEKTIRNNGFEDTRVVVRTGDPGELEILARSLLESIKME